MVRRQTRAQKRNRRQQNKSRRNNRRQNKSLRRKRQSRRKFRGAAGSHEHNTRYSRHEKERAAAAAAAAEPIHHPSGYSPRELALMRWDGRIETTPSNYRKDSYGTYSYDHRQ